MFSLKSVWCKIDLSLRGQKGRTRHHKTVIWLTESDKDYQSEGPEH